MQANKQANTFIVNFPLLFIILMNTPSITRMLYYIKTMNRNSYNIYIFIIPQLFAKSTPNIAKTNQTIFYDKKSGYQIFIGSLLN